jgi:hypothetical protein
MPSFGRVLTDGQIALAVSHLKAFCTDAAWPRGELNLPRALVTEKAFPEDEAVVSTTMASGTFVNDFLYEHRLGARTQYEVKVPVAIDDAGDGWHRGLGDIAAALKHTVYHSLERGRIVSVAGEVLLPTGKETEGLGKGVTIVEPYVAYGQILPRDSFLQVQAGGELSTDTERSAHEAFWRAAYGRTFVEGEFGRSWSPIVEVLAAKELQVDEPTLWDIVPQMQVSLSHRQHILFSAGIRIPVNARADRGAEVLTYFLWDWYDGGLFDGWR